MPIAFAVLMFTVNSNVVGCSMGKSPGLAPFNILSTYTAARRKFADVEAAYDKSPPASAYSVRE